MVSEQNYFPMPSTTGSGASSGGEGSSSSGSGLSGIFKTLLGNDPVSAGLKLAGTAIVAGMQPTQTDTFVDFDARSRANFQRGTKLSDAASRKYRQNISRLGAQRYQALERDYNDMLLEARNIGSLVSQDINRSFNAQLGAANQRMLSSGLASTTAAPGVAALINRERANALSRAGSQQSQLLTGLLGQRAAGLSRERAVTDAALLGVRGQDYAIRNMLAQRLATPTQTQKQSGSFFEKIF
jgi:hypothetical protein